MNLFLSIDFTPGLSEAQWDDFIALVEAHHSFGGGGGTERASNFTVEFPTPLDLAQFVADLCLQRAHYTPFEFGNVSEEDVTTEECDGETES